jgi:hypothetical protein
VLSLVLAGCFGRRHSLPFFAFSIEFCGRKRQKT